MHSRQQAPHPRLAERVRRHLESPWRGTIHRGSRAAFEHVLRWFGSERPLILDSGCGTGASSVQLGRRFPDAHVLGIDRSAYRLDRAPRPVPDNVRLIRARVEDIWRLLLEAGMHPVQHWLLYPNPWPKPAQLARRWHGHPVFPALLALGGTLVLRTNWVVYAEEFDQAARHCGAATSGVVSFPADVPLSPFERKYASSGHELFEVTIPAPVTG